MDLYSKFTIVNVTEENPDTPQPSIYHHPQYLTKNVAKKTVVLYQGLTVHDSKTYYSRGFIFVKYWDKWN
jgi:hypothetical protein